MVVSIDVIRRWFVREGSVSVSGGCMEMVRIVVRVSYILIIIKINNGDKKLGDNNIVENCLSLYLNCFVIYDWLLFCIICNI